VLDALNEGLLDAGLCARWPSGRPKKRPDNEKARREPGFFGG
jgi:hypothetical protein